MENVRLDSVDWASYITKLSDVNNKQINLLAEGKSKQPLFIILRCSWLRQNPFLIVFMKILKKLIIYFKILTQFHEHRDACCSMRI
jgi:hypothetical protein